MKLQFQLIKIVIKIVYLFCRHVREACSWAVFEEQLDPLLGEVERLATELDAPREEANP